jgi:hypothetical protein
MSHEPRSPQDEAAEREWALQEQAVQAERLHLDPTDNASVLRYRAIARTLRQPLDENLPADFAQHVATLASRRAAIEMRFELYVSCTLLGVLMAMLVTLVTLYGGAWLQLAQSSLPVHALMNPWLLALAACIALPYALNRFVPTR